MLEPTRFCDALRIIAAGLQAAEPWNVLIVGPGTSDPLGCIVAALNPTKMVVIEIDLEAVRELGNKWHDPRIRVVHGDAAKLSTDGPCPYDIVIVRHPDINRFQARWVEVFEAVASHLKDTGIILITAYSVAETELLLDCLADIGMCVQSGQDLSMQPVDLQGNDRYLLVARKC